MIGLISILSLLSLVQHTTGTLYFQQVGQLNPSPSYGHVHLVVDTNIVMAQLHTLEGEIAYVPKSVHTITHRQVEGRAKNFLIKAHMDINSMIREFTDLCHIVQETNPDKARVKRFLGLLLAISSLTMSLFNQAEILLLQGEVSDIATRQNHIVM